ncbi:CDP-diacylglycerol--glycerol-3-phosphate 3-phosphatidyltransferase [Calditerrivibrio nitroreducens]|uniref:CDP-diacylglycerol--glycerol-3-phosphate 3-phosphatidyltransferase n=1 Tax=Calditerrivibrio nitroreducens (strain DSM 19672 / NBRC 101217 / Yu37-1) TaxID=768670 RepID=E4TFJ6_CALNY|nr:CDP-diacylglycerol--glycerol-3-phosphate 3-phosphatidyltransferase [Calditerrivibrio nitroreducens]ADR19569.1 CDP-diacylglycerol/glycerol-3-phosphate3-phospha tidyltransferase [Calditerrivibrio nitroreducens DSM 19672]
MMFDKSFMNLPNQLTILRVLIIPFFLIFLYMDTDTTNIIATILFVIASITDYIDGYLARKYEIITDFGKILDPVADKILVASCMIVLVELNRLAGWIVILMLSRDFVVGALRNFAASKGVVIAAGFSGKLKTVLQMVAIGCLIFKRPLFSLDTFFMGKILIYIALFVSLYSCVVYYFEFFNKKEGYKEKEV